MKVKVEITEKDIKAMVAAQFRRFGHRVKPDDVKIKVKSKNQQEWEDGALQCVSEVEVEPDC